MSYQILDAGWYEASPVNMDPSLEDSTRFAVTAPWSQQQTHYQNHTSFPRCASSATLDNTGMRKAAVIASQPNVYMPRHCSPTEHMSSTCSSARSPPGESEYGLSDPSTPPDDMTLSPSAQYYDKWEIGGQQLFHLGAGLAESYIKPEEIYYQYHSRFYKEENLEFPTRGFSMSSNGSSCDTSINNRTEPVQMQRTQSPFEVAAQGMKQEVPVVESYPPFKSEHESLAFTQADDDKDADYGPKRPHRRIASSVPTRIQEKRKRSNASQPTVPPKKVKLEAVPTPDQRKGNFPCSECRDASFKDQSGLQKHIKQQHTRPFFCVFQFAGCSSTFATKNEWKRHVASQHLLLNYWFCQQDSCAKLSNSSGSSTKPTGTSRHRSSNACNAQSTLPDGAIFNRKDLYTQHLRRMHIPPAVKKQVKAKKPVPEWEDRVRACQEKAHKLRCDLPVYMTCPAPECVFQASGLNAWDERMEHVAKHLEKIASGQEASITFGGVNDPTLMTWVARPDIAVVKHDGRGWALNNPLKPEKNGARGQPEDEYGEEDADGEEIDD